MCNREQQPVVENTEISKDILQLYDELTEFYDRCSFLCDAFASIVANHEYVDENTINGFSCYSNWLKQQVGDIKAKLKHIHESSRNERR